MGLRPIDVLVRFLACDFSMTRAISHDGQARRRVNKKPSKLLEALGPPAQFRIASLFSLQHVPPVAFHLGTSVHASSFIKRDILAHTGFVGSLQLRHSFPLQRDSDSRR